MPDCVPISRQYRRWLHTGVLSIMLAFTAACAPVVLTDGRAPTTDRLSDLRVGQSTEADVRAALGEPRGDGMMRYASNRPELRNIWYYEYIQMKGDQIGLKLLLVFFDKGVYSGHLWFADKELTRASLRASSASQTTSRRNGASSNE